MTSAFTLREATPADAVAIEDLSDRSPDGGAVSFRARDHVDPQRVHDADRRTAVGVVAEAPGVEGVVGSARMVLGRLRYDGEERAYVLLSSLMVDPAVRRRGLGTALVRWRIERAATALDPERLIQPLL